MKPRRALAGASTGAVLSSGPSQSTIGLDDLLNQTSLSEIVQALGGPEIKRGRCRAWWRDGKSDTSVSFDAARGVWHDHGAGRGGGVLSLIEAARGGTRREAVAWLADFHGVRLRGTDPTEARRLAGRRRIARERAAELIRWRDMLVLALRDVRNCARDGANQIDRETIGADPDSPATWGRIALGIERRRIGDALEDYTLAVQAMTAGELTELRARLEVAPC